MKRRCLILLIIISMLCCSCSAENAELDRALQLRSRLLGAQGCTFNAAITADYGDDIYTFCMECSMDENGNLTFTVTAPETIAGITGRILDEKGALTFDDKVLAFPLIADGQLTPVSAPWVFVHTLRSGYLSACGREGDGLRLLLDDSYEEEALQLQILTDDMDRPSSCDILWSGRRILSIQINDFKYM